MQLTFVRKHKGWVIFAFDNHIEKEREVLQDGHITTVSSVLFLD